MEYMTSGPVVAMVWEGKNVVATGRTMLGATNPLESAPGTIRGDFSIEVGREGGREEGREGSRKRIHSHGGVELGCYIRAGCGQEYSTRVVG